MRTRTLVLLLSAAVAITALLTGPPSFDATDGAEFAVAGSRLEISHSPGYPLFLMLLRLFSLATSPLYGHLRLLNCLLGALAAWFMVRAARSRGASFPASAAAAAMFLFAAPVMAQFNSLEIYPLAIALTSAAVLLQGTRLAGYAGGMAIFGGHPVSVLAVPLMVPRGKKLFHLLTALIPATLMLYLPLRAQACRTAHYGHPSSLSELIAYFTMYSDRLAAPSLARLWDALSYIGPVTGGLYLLASSAAGRFRVKRDLPVLLSLLFLASYQLPDPAGQLWILLIPLTLRAAAGIDRMFSISRMFRWLLPALVLASAISGTIGSSRTSDDIALRWTTDVFSELPVNSIYRPTAHDVFYAAYASSALGFRPDVVLSDPYGNFFELRLSPPVPAVIGNRTVHLSRGWSRIPEFQLSGLLFHPAGQGNAPSWESMDIFRFRGSSPDPMALDLAAEAWARRMVQTGNPVLADSFRQRALELAATELTERRIENIGSL